MTVLQLYFPPLSLSVPLFQCHTLTTTLGSFFPIGTACLTCFFSLSMHPMHHFLSLFLSLSLNVTKDFSQVDSSQYKVSFVLFSNVPLNCYLSFTLLALILPTSVSSFVDFHIRPCFYFASIFSFNQCLWQSSIFLFPIVFSEGLFLV